MNSASAGSGAAILATSLLLGSACWRPPAVPARLVSNASFAELNGQVTLVSDVVIGDAAVAVLGPPNAICFAKLPGQAAQPAERLDPDCFPLETGFLSGLMTAGGYFYAPTAEASGFIRFQESGRIEHAAAPMPDASVGFIPGECVQFVARNAPSTILTTCFDGSTRPAQEVHATVRGLVGAADRLHFVIVQTGTRNEIGKRQCGLVATPAATRLWSGPCPTAFAFDAETATLYVATTNEILAFDELGKVRWSRDLAFSPRALATSMRVDRGRLYLLMDAANEADRGVFELRGDATLARIEGPRDVVELDVRNGLIAWTERRRRRIFVADVPE